MSKEKEQKQIDKLTPAQEAKIPEYVAEYRKVVMNTEKCNRPKAEDAIIRGQKYLKQPVPDKFIWVESPKQGAIQAAALNANKPISDVTTEEMRAMAGQASYGSFEGYWVAFYDFIATELPVKSDELIGIAKDIVNNSGTYWIVGTTCVISERPVMIRLDDKGELNCKDALAIEFSDGSGLFRHEGKQYRSLMDMTLSQKAKV